jgi:hypothetical protein
MTTVSQTVYEFEEEKQHSVKYREVGGRRAHYEPKVNLTKPYPKQLRVTVEATS